MFHCFIPDAAPGTIRITGENMHHIKNVLRMKQGEPLVISNGRDRDFYCKISGFEDDAVLAETENDGTALSELPADIILYQGLPKGDKMELIIQKAVELGAAAVAPVAMKRCVVKLDEKKQDKKLARWRKVAESAAEQSGRSRIPDVREVLPFGAAVETALRESDMVVVPYECAEGMEGTAQVLDRLAAGMTVSVFIGPEGGFEPDEAAKLKDAGAHLISLGRRILRTETAGLAAITILMIELEMKSRETV